MPKLLPPDAEDRLLIAAERRFWHFGPAKTTIEEIARDAGISKGAVYSFFATKEELGLAIIRRHVGEVLARQREIAEGAGTARARLREMLLLPVQTAYANVSAHPHGQAMAEMIFVRRPSPLESLIDEELRLYADVLTRGRLAGEFAEHEPAVVARVLRLATAAFLPPYTWLRDPAEAPDRAAETVDLLLRGLQPSPDAP